MTDQEYHWRLLSESLDRELSNEEQDCLEQFMLGNKASSEFVDLFQRIRERLNHQESIQQIDSSEGQYLGGEKKVKIQRLLEAAIENQQDALSNRDIVLACELVNHGAISLGGLTEKISQWNSESKTLSSFLKSQSTISGADFSKIESYVSDTIFSQTLDGTLHNEVVTAIKQRVPADACTVFDDASDEFASLEFITLINGTIAGKSHTFESLLDWLANDLRSVIQQTRVFSKTVRLKSVVDEVTLRLIGRKKLNQDQLECYYRSVGVATRKLFRSDPKLSSGLLGSCEGLQVTVAQVIDALDRLADEDPDFVQNFNLQFFAGLTVQQVARLLEVTDQEVSAESSYGVARLLQLIDE